jgi:outer membrane immunogenic protein
MRLDACDLISSRRITMNIRRSTAALAAIISLTAAPVLADGLSQPVIERSPAPVVAAVPGWGGFYLGGQLGRMNSTTASPFITGLEFAFSEASYGVHVGYMHDLGDFVLGAEIDHDIFNLGEGDIVFNGSELGQFLYDQDATTTRLKLRAGYNLGRILPYATAGVARLSVDGDTNNGNFLGLGVAYKATEKFLVGAEFLRQKFDGTDAGDVTANRISLRGSYRF